MSEIDINLAVLDTILPPGERLRCWQIAEIVGCSASRIQQIEAKALVKLRRKLAKEMPQRTNARLQSNRRQSKHQRAVGRFQRWLTGVNPEARVLSFEDLSGVV